MDLALTDDARLRSLTVADAPAFAEHVAGDLERLSEFLPWPAMTADVEGASAWINRYVNGADGRVLAAGIFDPDLIGGVVLLNHVESSDSVELGCWIVAAGEGRGLVRESCVQALKVARHGIGAERVEWHCDPRNVRSGGLATRLGFTYEGTLRSSYVLRGERLDTEVYGLIGEEIDAAISG